MISLNNNKLKIKNAGFVFSKILVISLIGFASIFAGCENNSFTLQLPNKFAQVDCKNSDFVAKGVDADGTVIAGKVENKNSSMRNTSPEFWEICVKRALENKGYIFVNSKEIYSSQKLPGRLLKFNYKSQKGDYIYLIAIFKQPGKKPVFLTEAGGLQKNISKTLEAEIVDCFRSIKLRYDSSRN